MAISFPIFGEDLGALRVGLLFFMHNIFPFAVSRHTKLLIKNISDLYFIGMLHADKLQRAPENIVYAARERQTECPAVFILAGNDGTFLIEAIEGVADIDNITRDDGRLHVGDRRRGFLRELREAS